MPLKWKKSKWVFWKSKKDTERITIIFQKDERRALFLQAL